MTRQRLTTIWSLFRRAEITVRIFYTARQIGSCRIYRLKAVDELEP